MMERTQSILRLRDDWPHVRCAFFLQRRWATVGNIRQTNSASLAKMDIPRGPHYATRLDLTARFAWYISPPPPVEYMMRCIYI